MPQVGLGTGEVGVRVGVTNKGPPKEPSLTSEGLLTAQNLSDCTEVKMFQVQSQIIMG